MPQIRHRWSFASTGARDAFVYPPDALNQWVRVTGTPPVTYQITSVSATGVATFATLGGAAAPVSSVFGRVGAVVAVAGDYAASQVTNDSSVAGADVKAALNALLAAIPPAAPVSSVFGRTGAVVAAGGDYTAAQVTGAVANTRQIIAGSGLTGGGDLSADRTLTLDPTSAIAKINLPQVTAADFTLPSQQPAFTVSSLEIGDTFTVEIGDEAVVEIIDTPIISARRKVWHPDKAPAQPSPWDDEFDGTNGSPLDPKWNDFAPGASVNTYTINGRGALEVTQTTHAGSKLAGKWQLIPNSEFCFAAKVGFNGASPAATFDYGIFVAQDLQGAPTTSKFAHVHVEATAYATALIAAGQTFTDYQTFASTQQSQTITNLDMYLMGRMNGTACNWDISWNGEDWEGLVNTTLSFSPISFGLFVNNINTGVTQMARFHWFRVLGTGSGSSTFGACYNGGFLDDF